MKINPNLLTAEGGHSDRYITAPESLWETHKGIKPRSNSKADALMNSPTKTKAYPQKNAFIVN